MFSTLLHSFGLDISDLSLKLIAVKSNLRNEYVCAAWARTDLAEGIIEEGEIKKKDILIAKLKEMIEEPLIKINSPYVVASLPESKTFIKVIEISNEGDMRQSIMEELPNHIPVNLDELVIDWDVAHTFENRAMVTVAAAPKTIVENYTDLLMACGLKVTAFEIEAQAIARAVTPLGRTAPSPREQFLTLLATLKQLHRRTGITQRAPLPQQQQSAQLIVDLGATRTSLILTDWSTIQFTTSLPLSGVEATKQIASRLKLTFDEAERAKRICGLDPKKCKGIVNGVLEGVLNKLALEIERAIDFYKTHFNRGHTVSSVLLSGGGASLAHAEKYLENQISVPICVSNPCNNITFEKEGDFPKKESLSFTTAIGLALRDLSQ